MSKGCDRCKNIKLYYNTNKGRGGNRSIDTPKIKTVTPRSIYLIMHNDKIIRFCVSKKEGMKYMRELARIRILNYTPDYKTYIEEIGTMIRISGMHRFFIISYEKILDEFELIKVHGIPNITAQYDVFKQNSTKTDLEQVVDDVVEKVVDEVIDEKDSLYKVEKDQVKRHSAMLKEMIKKTSNSDLKKEN